MVPVPGGWRRWRAHNLSRCVCSRCLSAVHTFICRSIQRHLRFRERAVPWMALQSPAVSGTVSFLQSWKVPPSSLHRQLYEAHTKGLLLIECSYVNVMCTEYARPTRSERTREGRSCRFQTAHLCRKTNSLHGLLSESRFHSSLSEPAGPWPHRQACTRPRRPAHIATHHRRMLIAIIILCPCCDALRASPQTARALLQGSPPQPLPCGLRSTCPTVQLSEAAYDLR